MPINSTALYIKSLLDGTQPPGETGLPGPLVALITPYDPDESGEARAYIWPTAGPEKRRAIPRGPVTVNGGPAPQGTAGWKQMEHAISIFLVWFGYDSDDQIDSSFPLLIDHVMAVLRSSPNTGPGNIITDPQTGMVSQIVDLGEDMTYEYVPVLSTDDQRITRYDCRIEAHCTEMFQA